VDASRRFLTHRVQQIRSDAPKTRIAKAAKIFLHHMNPPSTNVRV
jgi:hypothetical protein